MCMRSWWITYSFGCCLFGKSRRGLPREVVFFFSSTHSSIYHLIEDLDKMVIAYTILRHSWKAGNSVIFNRERMSPMKIVDQIWLASFNWVNHSCNVSVSLN